MPPNSAEYQRAYRARVKARRPVEVATEPEDPTVARLRARILDLEDEVRHLKTELARRPVARLVDPTFNSRPFTPVPKK